MANEITVTLTDQIAELKREIAIRERVYAGWIINKRMKVDSARKGVATLKATLHLLMEFQGTVIVTPDTFAGAKTALLRDRVENGGFDGY